MNTNFLGLRTTIYKVDDLKKAALWYAKIFKTKPYFNNDDYIGFNISGYELGLISETNSTIQKTENVLTYWGVNDIDKEYQRMLKAGASTYEKPHNVGGEIVVGAVKDLWGNVIGLIYNPMFEQN